MPRKTHFLSHISGPIRPILLIFELSLSFSTTFQEKKILLRSVEIYSSYRVYRQTDGRTDRQTDRQTDFFFNVDLVSLGI